MAVFIRPFALGEEQIRDIDRSGHTSHAGLNILQLSRVQGRCCSLIRLQILF